MTAPAADATVQPWGAVEGTGLDRFFRPRFLVLSVVLWLAFGLLTVVVLSYPIWVPGDLAVAQWVQSVSWGPLSAAFGVISWLSGGPQIVLAVLIVIAIFFVNRRATPLALIAAVDAGIYDGLNTVIHKARPTPGLIRVTEQAGAYAYPSGHATFVVTIVAVLLLCIGVRILSRRLLLLASLVGLAIVSIVGIERIYVGAHYPTDVLGGFLLASAWLSLLLSIRWLSDPVLNPRRPKPASM
ncbi:MAG TPA: phosphatase PAP2 family protein [Candidatus Dormibacteraeota bacterium]|nr:phosphatase PAP2 family protein [Candidatus Dormibacteraeota bacterium]